MHRNLALADKAFARTFDVPNLNETRERELLLRTRSDSPTPDSQAALTELWMSHGKLVASIAAKYRRTDIEHDDLINAGHLGLHTAIMRYDTERFDTRLSAYAAIWIKSSIHDYIRRNTGPVRLPESKGHRLLAQSATRLLAEARKACEREGTEPTDSALHERIGQRIGLGANEVANGLRLIQGARTCLDTGEENGEDGGLPDERIPTADDMNRRLDHDRLRARIRVLADEVLGDRERRIFLDRCMADSEQVPSLDSFATRFNVSVVRVHQIEASARRKIAAQQRSQLIIATHSEALINSVDADHLCMVSQKPRLLRDTAEKKNLVAALRRGG